MEKDAPNHGWEEFRAWKLSFIVAQVGFIISIIEFNEYKELKGKDRKEVILPQQVTMDFVAMIWVFNFI